MDPKEPAGPDQETRQRLAALERAAESAYDLMYDARSPSDATAQYSNAKEALYTAIGEARRSGDEAAAERLSKRLAHIKAVFRSQFT